MEKIRFYTTDSNNYWKQCKYCGAFCQLVIDNKPTGRSTVHYGDCAVFAYEQLLITLTESHKVNTSLQFNPIELK